MAMLLVNKVFASTWAGYVDEAPEDEFWETIITQVKARFPHFLFAAEVYWGMEARLQQQGFDFTYDKLLYDRIVPGDVEKIRLHLLADIPFQKRSLRFIENHDEPRAAATLGEEIARPAAVLISTLPGAVLLHDGQLIGRRIKLPVQIRRQPEEPIDGSLLAYYRLLLAETRSSVYQTGEWQLLETHPAWGGNGTHEYLITYGWRNNGGESVTFRLIAINFTGEQAQAQVNLSSWPEIAEYNWCLHDVLNGDSFYHTADNLTRFGLYIDLPPYHAHIFAFDRVEGLLSNGTPGE
jgi:hypothetical protein